MELLGLVGYGVAAIVWGLFTVLLISARKYSFARNFLVASIGVTFLSLLLSAIQVYQSFSLLYVFIVEFFKLLVWSLFLLNLRYSIQSFSQFWQSPEIRKFLIVAVIAIAVSVYSIQTINQFSWFFTVLLALTLYPLVLVEQLYRNGSETQRWAFWPLLIGLGAMLVYDFIMYAQGALLNRLDFNFWYARGFVLTFSMPFILLTSKRIKDWSNSLFVSRDVVFYSTMLVIGGSYLLLLSFAGYIIRFIEGQWSGALAVGFLALGLIVFAPIVLMQSFRNKVKVFITKHFFANKYDYRNEWLKLTNAIETANANDIYQDACVAFKQVLPMKICGYVKINNMNICEPKFVSDFNFTDESLLQMRKIADFCQQKSWIIDVREYQHNHDKYKSLDIDEQPLLTQHIDVLAPVVHQQKLLGFFVFSHVQDKPTLNFEDRDFIFAVSNQLGNYIFLQQAQQQISQSQQFNVFSRMSAFVLHDLKNIQAQLSLINANAERHRDNPEFVDDVFDTVNSAASRLEKVVKQLANKNIDKMVDQKQVDIASLLEEVLVVRNQQKPYVTLAVENDCSLNIDKDGLLSIISHLIQNAQEACSADGDVTVKANVHTESLQIEISDTGEGMSKEFIRQQLFKPFETTKGNSGMGIGAYEARHFIEQNGGVLNVVSVPEQGSTFTIKLPLSH
ncbi:XrtA/PEP-CTERM system histidine kinase PrsK [Thalassotalea crassostreae]|uniref:XrtA/PEP-CTERM system histidine kinase PrsK n=1 Tax=Thalassotalea crassostreae TaxID=1763536 RepID=UPI0008396F08|nr:XrtA/PEP-CTERM system histidine kinase PrsK [Thalassotalea crassostreae]